MSAVFKREFKAYFTSPIGFVIIGLFSIISIFIFFATVLTGKTVDMGGYFSTIIIIYAVIVPLITMRLMSEEKRQKTDQCLFTSPISLTSIVMGKFLSAFVLFSITLSFPVIYAIIINAYMPIELWVFIGNMVGMLLVGSSFVAIGLFISSLTENQAVAAIGSLITILLFIATQLLTFLISGLYTKLPSLSLLISSENINNLINYVSVIPRYSNFSMGIFNLADALYFFSIATVFIFLTVRVLEKRRWS
jgi:ABC-2 type transport system permease protein